MSLHYTYLIVLPLNSREVWNDLDSEQPGRISIGKEDVNGGAERGKHFAHFHAFYSIYGEFPLKADIQNVFIALSWNLIPSKKPEKSLHFLGFSQKCLISTDTESDNCY